MTGRRPLSQQTSPNIPTKQFGSGYACLHIEEPSDATTAATEDADLYSDADVKQVCRATVEEPDAATGPCIADDEIADAFELVSIIQVRHHKGKARILLKISRKSMKYSLLSKRAGLKWDEARYTLLPPHS